MVTFKNDSRTRFDQQSIGFNITIDQSLIQPPDGFDRRQLLAPRTTTEGDSGTITDDQFLQYNRHGTACRIKAKFLAIQQGTVRPERRPHQSYAVKESGQAVDIDKRVVEAGKGCSRRILRRGGRANCERGAGQVGGGVLRLFQQLILWAAAC